MATRARDDHAGARRVHGGRSRCSSSRPRPSGTDGHVNVSPKGLDTFRVLDDHTVAYLDLTGSGVETIAHLRENGRITLMVCAFEGRPADRPPAGPGRVILVTDRRGGAVPASGFPELPGARAIIDVDVDRISTSCGYAVPLMDSSATATQLSTGPRRRATTASPSTGRRRTRRASTVCPDGADANRSPRAVARARERMDELGIDVLLLSVGADLPYLTGYEAMPLERLTMLVLPRDGDAQLVVPAARGAAGRRRSPELFEIVPWDETDDPIALVAELVGSAARSVAIGDHTWARFVLDLQSALPARFVRAAHRRSSARSGW